MADTPNVVDAPPKSSLPVGDLVRAMGAGVLALAAVASLAGFVLFSGSVVAADSSAVADTFQHYMLGLCAAVFAAMFTLWLHGRLASRPSLGGLELDGKLEGQRLQALLAAGFGVKLLVLVVGVLLVRSFPLNSGDVKFAQIATFAITFAGAALVLQFVTAVSISRSLSQQKARVLS